MAKVKKQTVDSDIAYIHFRFLEVAQGERGELWVKGPNIMKVNRMNNGQSKTITSPMLLFRAILIILKLQQSALIKMDFFTREI